MIIWIVIGVALSFGFIAFFGAPYVPTLRREVERALDIAEIGKGDLLVDLGSGDGRVLRAAARKGCRAVGYELHPLLVAWSRWRSRGDKDVRVVMSDYTRADWPDDVTVVFVFGASRFMRGIADAVRRHESRTGRSIKLVSYGFELPGVSPTTRQGAVIVYGPGVFDRDLSK